MTLCERLRQPVMLHYNPETVNAERREAAAEIERLRAALREIATGYEWSGSNCREAADAALADEQSADLEGK